MLRRKVVGSVAVSLILRVFPDISLVASVDKRQTDAYSRVGVSYKINLTNSSLYADRYRQCTTHCSCRTSPTQSVAYSARRSPCRWSKFTDSAFLGPRVAFLLLNFRAIVFHPQMTTSGIVRGRCAGSSSFAQGVITAKRATRSRVKSLNTRVE